MAPVVAKRRRNEEGERRPKKKIKVKRQKEYHSSSEDEGEEPEKNIAKATSANAVPINSAPKSILKQRIPIRTVDEAEDEFEDESDQVELNTALNAAQTADSDDETEDMGELEEVEKLEEGTSVSGEEDDDSASDQESETTSMTSSNASQSRKKRNDPSAFATSISKILDTKLTTGKRQDPVLSRSKSATDANKTLSNDRLEQKARSQIRAEKQQALEKGRVKDVLGVETEGVETGAVLEEENRLKKTAQRGVVKLFNAVRAAQVQAEQGMKQARTEGVVGMQKREERVNEMSKQGFLDLISSGGKKAAAI